MCKRVRSALDSFGNSNESRADLTPNLYWGILEHVFPHLADNIEDNPKNLFTLKRFLDDMGNRITHTRVWEADDQLLKELNVGQSLHEYVLNERLVSILSSIKIEKDESGCSPFQSA